MRSIDQSEDRLVALGAGCAAIPERLLLAHAQGRVLFIVGAGASKAAGLPDFRKLALLTYADRDASAHEVLNTVPPDASNKHVADCSTLTAGQSAEVQRYIQGDYDVTLGMLERRLDGLSGSASSVRQTVAKVIRDGATQPAPIHRSLAKLADRGGATTIITTNFDLLLEAACRRKNPRVQTYSLGAIPRPSRRPDFAGIFHIHGALEKDPKRFSDLVLSDHDFGEFYMRRRSIPDFIYDAARLFNIVLVGYSANDPPMRYLLNAVAADGSRFDDLKTRYSFVGGAYPADPRIMEDWKARGIIPIPYDEADGHSMLGRTLARWASLSAHNGKRELIDKEIRRIVRKSRTDATDSDRDLFDHLVRRADASERVRLAQVSSKAKAGMDWLTAFVEISGEGQ